MAGSGHDGSPVEVEMQRAGAPWDERRRCEGLPDAGALAGMHVAVEPVGPSAAWPGSVARSVAARLHALGAEVTLLADGAGTDAPLTCDLWVRLRAAAADGDLDGGVLVGYALLRMVSGYRAARRLRQAARFLGAGEVSVSPVWLPLPRRRPGRGLSLAVTWAPRRIARSDPERWAAVLAAGLATHLLDLSGRPWVGEAAAHAAAHATAHARPGEPWRPPDPTAPVATAPAAGQAASAAATTPCTATVTATADPAVAPQATADPAGSDHRVAPGAVAAPDEPGAWDGPAGAERPPRSDPSAGDPGPGDVTDAPAEGLGPPPAGLVAPGDGGSLSFEPVPAGALADLGFGVAGAAPPRTDASETRTPEDPWLPEPDAGGLGADPGSPTGADSPCFAAGTRPGTGDTGAAAPDRVADRTLMATEEVDAMTQAAAHSGNAPAGRAGPERLSGQPAPARGIAFVGDEPPVLRPVGFRTLPDWYRQILSPKATYVLIPAAGERTAAAPAVLLEAAVVVKRRSGSRVIHHR